MLSFFPFSLVRKLFAFLEGFSLDSLTNFYYWAYVGAGDMVESIVDIDEQVYTYFYYYTFWELY